MEKVLRFEKIFFSAPKPKKSGSLILVLGVLYGFLASSFLGITPHPNFIYSFLMSSALFIFPAIGYGAITSLLIENFFPRRAFLISLINQGLVFLGLILSGPLFTFLLGFIYSVNILSVAGISNRKGAVPLIYSLLYPGSMWVFLHLTGVFPLAMFGGLIFLSIGVATFLSIHLVEYFFRLNLEGVSALSIFSSFLNEEPAELGCGIEIDPLVQNLKYETEDEQFRITLPWLHPGPVRYLGGGSMSASLIQKLNRDGKGYFWHVPSSHEEDPTDPQIVDRIFDLISEQDADKEKSTRLLSRQKENFRVYGQKVGNFYLIFVDSKQIDDFEISIFQEIWRNLDEPVVFIDIHNHLPFTGEKILSHSEKRAGELSQAIYDLLEELNSEEQYGFKVGMEVSEDGSWMVLLEEIDAKRYLFVTLDINGISKSLENELQRFTQNDRFDEAIFLTTDAHKTVEFLGDEEKIDPKFIEKTIDSISERISKAKIGLDEKIMHDIRVLGKDCHHLEASVTFGMYLFPAILGFIYLSFFAALMIF